MSSDLPPQVQNQITQFQQLQQQLQVITTQIGQLELKEREIENTIEELKKTKKDAPIYKSIGTLLIRAENREELEKELNEHKETISIRLKTLQRQEKTLSERYQSLGEKLSKVLRGAGQGG
ncbi:MAG: prefoldin subunit beta [Thermoplasmata archaeon]